MVQFSRKGNLQRFHSLIFADGHSRTATFLQNELLSIKAQLQPLHSQQFVFLPAILAREKTSHSDLFFVDQSVLITRFTSALADCMDDDGPVVDRGPRGSGSLVVSLDALK